ncbi:MAG: serine/threonine protein kinase, partial [Bradymonadaceae bacterium]
MSEQNLLPGTIIANKYRIESAVGSGGFGTVYRATHLDMNRTVAVKIFKPTPAHLRDPAKLDARKERFNREAQFVSKLEHPNTVTIFDYGQDKDMLYLVMELIEGQTLRELLWHNPRLPLPRAIFIACEILESLEEAHHKGILHRDLKPPNILITKDFKGKERVKVLDFGIAKQVIDGHFGAEDVELTGNTFIGTPQYCSPEQLFTRPLSKATDIFGVGILLWEMIFGEPLVKGDGIGTAIQQLNAKTPWEVPLEPPIPPGLRMVLERAVQRDQTKRFQSCAEMLEALKAIPLHKPSTLPVPGAREEPGHTVQLTEAPSVETLSDEPRLMAPNILEGGFELDMDVPAPTSKPAPRPRQPEPKAKA